MVRRRISSSGEGMETTDGWKFVCKLCGEDHEVPEEIAPYRMEDGTLHRVLPGEVALGCPNSLDKIAQYTFTDFTAYRVTVSE